MKRNISPPGLHHVSAGHQRDRLLVAMAIRMARAALGWSQAEFGRFLGMSQRAIHRIESKAIANRAARRCSQLKAC
jgi:DNA-binding XRE family transcriptional regulator